MSSLPLLFLDSASRILADTDCGLTGREIVEYSAIFSEMYNTTVPVSVYPWDSLQPPVHNKKEALCANLKAFSESQQYQIIKSLCELPKITQTTEVTDLKAQLVQQFGERFGDDPMIDCSDSWDNVERCTNLMNRYANCASSTEEYNAVGTIGRQTCVHIARIVYEPSIHTHTFTNDNGEICEIGHADAKRMIDSYVDFEFAAEDSLSKALKKSLKSQIELCNKLLHDFDATKRHAMLCAVSVTNLARTIKTIQDN